MTMSTTRVGSPAAVPCAARPYASLVHTDGACRCFTGGPPPEYAAPRPLGARLGLVGGGLTSGTRWVPTTTTTQAERAC
ncbi:hypothetical protein ACWFNE_09040 [Cellulomonas sp. NPDC055163]